MKTVIYLHGFNSSPKSEKAGLCKRYIEQHSDISVVVPSLSVEPLTAISLVQGCIDQAGKENILGFIGSSLGGFYALYLQYNLQHKHPSCSVPKLVLINPAIRPYELLQDYLGDNQNPYTGERFRVEPKHMTDLQSLVVPPLNNSSNSFLLTQTADEVLDFQDAVSRLAGARMWIQYGGNHAFENYPAVLPAILNFLKS